jgi:hypothetical protein
MSAQFIEAVESLLRFFGDLPGAVEFKDSYRTRLPTMTVENVATCLEHEHRIFEARALRHDYELVRVAFYAKRVHPDSLMLSDEEKRRLAAMNSRERRRAIMFLCGSTNQLQRDLRVAIDRIVTLLRDVRKSGKTRIERDEANARARGALRGRPPKGNKRWTQRTLAKAIGCSSGIITKLRAWQAYTEERGLKSVHKAAAPKAVSLTDGALATEDGQAAMERLRLAEIEKAAAEQIAESEADRRHYRRRRKV